MDLIDRVIIACRLTMTAGASIMNVIFPEIFNECIILNIKKLKTVIDTNGCSDCKGVHDSVYTRGEGTCIMAEESTGSNGSHGYDTLQDRSDNQSESDES